MTTPNSQRPRTRKPRRTYAADKEWSGGDVCEAAASLLNRFSLVPETDGEFIKAASPEGRIPRYALRIDGPRFRAQRQLPLNLLQWAQQEIPLVCDPDHEHLLEGLIHLTAEIADQGHDNHGVDCLIDEQDDIRR